jgi:hypothetical protein
VSVAISVAALAACSDEALRPLSGATVGSGGGGGAPQAPSWPNLVCDPLVPEICAYPFPSNVYTVPDETTPTGRRVSLLDGTLPAASNGYRPGGAPWSASDGFSAGMALLAYLPGAAATGLPTAVSIASSLEDGSPTVLFDTETGARVAHWVEIDHASDVPSERALMIRPAVRLEDARRYVVAIRRVTDAGGAVIAPSPAFAALRDGAPFPADPSIEARRSLYDAIFAALQEGGVAREDLQLAWDFTTASRESNTRRLLHMRDEALLAAGDGGPAYRIDSVDTDFNPSTIAYRIRGTMTAPLYLDQPGPGATLLFGADGLPAPNASQPSYDVPWELLIPTSARARPAKLLQYGHGLLGSRKQIEGGHHLSFMQSYGYAMFAVNLDGMAEDDEPWIGERVAKGELDELSHMFDRMHQGVLNNLLAMRMMKNGLAKHPTFGPLLDATERYYFGISQGGIFGGVYMSLTTDVERGVMDVMGQPYTLLLNRSVDFDPFFALLKVAVPDARDRQTFQGAVQMLWDRAEPNGYSRYVVHAPLPGTSPHRVMLRAALGDHQVPTHGAHVMARAVGAVHLDTGVRDVWGLVRKPGPLRDPAVYVEYDFGLPPEPACNAPMTLCEDPHGKLSKLPEARAQLDRFLRSGEATQFCTGGVTMNVCTHPELSGCSGGESSAALCR